jgi:hypothetical protein
MKKRAKKLTVTEVHPTRASVAVARAFGSDKQTLEHRELLDAQGKKIASGYRKKS